MGVAEVLARKRSPVPEFLEAMVVVPTGKGDLQHATMLARGLAMSVPAPAGVGLTYLQYFNELRDDLQVTEVCIAAYREDGTGLGLAASSYLLSGRPLTSVPHFRVRPSEVSYASYVCGKQPMDVLAGRAFELALMDYEVSHEPMPAECNE